MFIADHEIIFKLRSLRGWNEEKAYLMLKMVFRNVMA